MRTNPDGQRRQSIHGFTLIEILLVLGLFALMATVVFTGTNAFLSRHDRSAEDIFWSAIDAASKTAIETDRTARLSIEEEGTVLAVETDGKILRFPLPANAMVDLLRRDGRSSALLGGRLIETDGLEYVRFFRDGTCEVFRAQLRIGDAEPKVLSLDPWTCSPVLPNREGGKA